MAVGDVARAGVLLTSAVDVWTRLGDIWNISTTGWQRLAALQDTDEAEATLALADELATVPVLDRHARVWRSIALSKAASTRGRGCGCGAARSRRRRRSEPLRAVVDRGARE